MHTKAVEKYLEKLMTDEEKLESKIDNLQYMQWLQEFSRVEVNLPNWMIKEMDVVRKGFEGKISRTQWILEQLVEALEKHDRKNK